MSLAAVFTSRIAGSTRRLRAARLGPRRAGRAGFSAPSLALAVTVWLVVAGNFPFWRGVWNATGGLRAANALFLLSVVAAALAWVYLLLSLLAWGRATRPVLAAVVLISAAVGYFMNTYGVLFDQDMLASVIQTHAGEALDLLSWRLAAWIAAFAGPPLLILARARVASQGWKRDLAIKLTTMLAAAACLLVAVLSCYQSYAALARNHRELRLLLVPSNIAAAAHGYLKRIFAAPAVLEVIGADARLSAPPGGAVKPRLTLLVVGETARAANFSLNGYERPTNPELARRGVISFTNVSSCGTSTAVSVPCMFLDLGREGYRPALAGTREGLLDVLQRAGVAVRWRDNNAGCKGVCERVPHDDLTKQQVPGLCDDGECYDEILLRGLQEEIDRLSADGVIVLHMMGSHGPAYFKRYPPAFETFTPACGTVDLDRCERQAIVNAYDNSLRYTDHVLARAIDLLAANAHRFDAALLYVSDHGESLGEKGLYLHGFPYALAPSEQVHVPMVAWLSEGARRRLGLDVSCLGARRDAAYSHDHLFHSMLGLAGVQTSAYRPERDVFRSCAA
jgi:lipid A ethanolaminephosphotransferase